MPKYDQLAEAAWLAILNKVKELEKNGMSRAEISRLLGHKGRSAVTNWLKGNTTAVKSSFAEMIRYMDVLGVDVSAFLPWGGKSGDCAGVLSELEKLRAENAQLKERLIQLEARAGAFQELLEKKLIRQDDEKEKKSA